jgi:hypothetical protein
MSFALLPVSVAAMVELAAVSTSPAASLLPVPWAPLYRNNVSTFVGKV